MTKFFPGDYVYDMGFATVVDDPYTPKDKIAIVYGPNGLDVWYVDPNYTELITRNARHASQKTT